MPHTGRMGKVGLFHLPFFTGGNRIKGIQLNTDSEIILLCPARELQVQTWSQRPSCPLYIRRYHFKD